MRRLWHHRDYRRLLESSSCNCNGWKNARMTTHATADAKRLKSRTAKRTRHRLVLMLVRPAQASYPPLSSWRGLNNTNRISTRAFRWTNHQPLQCKILQWQSTIDRLSSILLEAFSWKWTAATHGIRFGIPKLLVERWRQLDWLEGRLKILVGGARHAEVGTGRARIRTIPLLKEMILKSGGRARKWCLWYVNVCDQHEHLQYESQMSSGEAVRSRGKAFCLHWLMSSKMVWRRWSRRDVILWEQAMKNKHLAAT